jgi:hypothetical protein
MGWKKKRKKGDNKSETFGLECKKRQTTAEKTPDREKKRKNGRPLS